MLSRLCVTSWRKGSNDKRPKTKFAWKAVHCNRNDFELSSGYHAKYYDIMIFCNFLLFQNWLHRN